MYDRTHQAPQGIPRKLDVETPGDWCWGQLQAVYTRKGTPAKWVRVGQVCLRCRALIVDPEFAQQHMSA